MTYCYRIAGRSFGVIDQEIYTGTVEAANNKQAILFALVAEFGDFKPTNTAEAVLSLTEEGWIERDLFMEQYQPLEDTAEAFEFAGEEHTYVVEIREELGTGKPIN